ncbi:MAG TPA: LPS export ABC transporter permease LptF [Candidatus Solibacter sp.]|nr:LPS export ABC transporter permease LptF [Candidatus Solibacter sp.]
MRILTRYILREVTALALIGAAIFTFVLFTRDLGHILELVVRASAPLPSVAEIFFFTIPLALTYTLPMSVLLGILIGLSRLAADSEITAMRASGMGIWSFLRSLSIFVIAAWVLALANGIYIAPRSQAALGHLEDRLKGSQVSFEIQPRVFYEGFPKYVLYVQDVKSAQGAAVWKGVFMADLTDASNPRITLAKEGIVVSEGQDRLHLHLIDGSAHETDPKDAAHYQISTFQQTDIPIELPSTENKPEESLPAGVMNTWDLPQRAARTDATTARWYMIEFHRRFALPTACLVLALVGIPLGLSSKKSGKSGGFVLTILLVFSYYVISLIGVSLARQGKVAPWFGAWLADLVFLALALFLLRQSEKRPFEFGAIRPIANPLSPSRTPLARRRENAFERASTRRRMFSASFPTLLDDYVLRDFLLYLGMILSTFLVLVIVFTLFELLGDILRNQVPATVVAAYLLNVAPYLLYNVAPLVMLLAVLVTFGLMQRANEITAIKATGVSIYRIVTPVIVAAGVLATALFLADQFYLPRTNQRQEALHNQIKGKPPQTYLRPDRKWIFGQHNDIYYYQFFDPDRDQFGNVTVFQLDRATFTITQRIHAERAHWAENLNRWIYEQGWQRALIGSAIAPDGYRTFDVSTFPELRETPSYFKKEVKQYTEMNYEELRRYIRDLQQSGFDVVRLRVQLHKKLSYPVITLIMAVLAIPFSLSTGKKGAITGVAVAVGIAVFYTVVSRLFEAMGDLSQLPPALAAWSPDLIFMLVGGYLILKVPT